jgi:hypothetical protein
LIGIEQFQGGNWIAQDSVAQQKEGEGVEYSLSESRYSGPLVEKVVGWACLVAISAGVTSRTGASNGGPGVTNHQHAGEKKLDDASCVPSYRRF